jgi:hypothetical protein
MGILREIGSCSFFVAPVCYVPDIPLKIMSFGACHQNNLFFFFCLEG